MMGRRVGTWALLAALLVGCGSRAGAAGGSANPTPQGRNSTASQAGGSAGSSSGGASPTTAKSPVAVSDDELARAAAEIDALDQELAGLDEAGAEEGK